MNSPLYNDILDRFFYSKTISEYSLDAITRASEYFGNPHHSFKGIHIAGTNGKWSVARMIFQILKDAKKTVGIYTSPHIADIRERFETQSGMISEEGFCTYAEKILTYPEPLSYFERCVLLAFLYFQDMGVEYGVIEVGMGGRLDATNILTPIVSIITNISLDHTEFLGNTLEAIAQEKWGIIKPHIPVIMSENCPDILYKIAATQNAPVIPLTHDTIHTNLAGEHQLENARIAFTAGVFLGIPGARIKSSLLKVWHPWRLQYIRPNVLLDGAHNIDGLEKLKKYIHSIRHEWNEIHTFFTLKSWKNTKMITDIFGNIGHWGILDVVWHQLQSTKDLAHEMQAQNHRVRILTSEEIIREANINRDHLYVVFGSLYMLHTFARYF